VTEADQVIDLRDPKGPVRCVEIHTPAGIVRVNVDLVVVATGQPSVSVEIEANQSWKQVTEPGGHWDITQREHAGRGLEVSLHRREGS
jgi:hypothetical protein